MIIIKQAAIIIRQLMAVVKLQWPNIQPTRIIIRWK
jgi:hypothetical protein